MGSSFSFGKSASLGDGIVSDMNLRWETNKEKKIEMQVNKSIGTKEGFNRRQSRSEKKIALEQDVDKLKKKLRQEENVHRALERAFTRPLGALPRLPPYLPSQTLELLAEVAVLEEEVVRLEEQVVNFRQGLYQEAIYFSTTKKIKGNATDRSSNGQLSQSSKFSEQPKQCSTLPNGESLISAKPTHSRRYSLDVEQLESLRNESLNVKRTPNKQSSSLDFSENQQGKENQWVSNFSRNPKQSPVKKVTKVRVAASENKHANALPECAVMDKKGVGLILSDASDEVLLDKSSGSNKLSEDILKCLMNIFLSIKSSDDMETSSSSSGSCENIVGMDSRDPYDICAEFGKRDIGPYKHFRSVDVSSNGQKLLMASSSFKYRLKPLFRKLESVDISKLTHWQKLAFWINIYNSCMMNAFLEQGIPTRPEMVVALMPKAVINVGGHLLSAMTIEHFILRLPYHIKNAKVSTKGPKNESTIIRGVFGLEWPEPLVTFALSCGSWSSPAVRVYTAARVEKELETAKMDYLQAAVGISKLAIPKLLHWYLLDFAKDIESLMDWVCLQLPGQLRTEAVKCLEESKRSVIPQAIQIRPYEFRFSGRWIKYAFSLFSGEGRVASVEEKGEKKMEAETVAQY
ncbi:uncharacterized protein LOC121996501 isoform X3 [Zingiber officinale]|uniref:uncharacterized protein LOC121996501 isoform X3 n=1 Tax=Zingiber officinale TaxID=94328 RepID=UPI001C4AA0B2|nr:uncharacterized protein LOC121996501 isoform X3 [Zingiber officinale]